MEIVAIHVVYNDKHDSVDDDGAVATAADKLSLHQVHIHVSCQWGHDCCSSIHNN